MPVGDMVQYKGRNCFGTGGNVRLKSFETYGFKSFAEKIELNFEKGITAIVGPNGSGKSNISDAIRWVLGEQSAKYLRGSKMEDVIFSGTNKRRALGMAEVNLVFDNSDHQLPLDFDEVSICRRVFRSGDSEYYINKKACRLKDVLDLLADTGLGRGSMSIIGQNKIDEILNSRPEERRALFEEAAGISKYRTRKKEAMRRLEDTALNLTRIYDIKAEIESRIEPLRLSAEKTTKYLKMAAELRACRVTQFVHKIEGIEAVSQKLETKIEELTALTTELTGASNLKENQGLTLKLELDQLNEEYNALQSGIAERETRLEKLHGKEAVLGERIKQSQKAQARVALQREKLFQQLNEVEGNLKEITDKYDNLEQQQHLAQITVDRCAGEQLEKEQKIIAIETKIGDFKSAAFASMQEIVNLRNEIRALEQAQELRQRKREQLKEQLQELDKNYAQLGEHEAGYLQEQLTVANEITLLKTQGQALVAQRKAEEEKLTTLTKQRTILSEQIASLQTRATMLANMQKEYDGFGRGVKTLLQSRQPWRQGIIGVVAELFKVPEQYVLAIETALGGAVQNLVVHQAAVAKEAIEFLKKEHVGRATFLPLDTLKPYALRSEEYEAGKLPGMLGAASELVTCSQELQVVAKFLLGRVLVAENMQAALQAAKRANYRLRIVTLEGEVINPGGSMTGGSRQQKESGFLSRKNEILVAETRAVTLQRELLSVQEKIENAEEIIQGAQLKIEALKKTLQKNEIRQAELTAYLERVTAERQQNLTKITLLNQEKNQYSAEYLAARQQLGNLRPNLLEQEQQDVAAKAEVDKMQAELVGDQRALTTLRNHYQNARITLEAAKERTTLISERIKQIDGDVGRLQGEIADLDAECERLEATVATSEKEKAGLLEEQKILLVQLREVSGGKEEFTAKRLQIIEAQAAAEEDLNAVKQQLAASQQKLHQAELEKVKQVTEYEAALEQMASNYQISLDDAKNSELFLELSETALRKQEVTLLRAIEELGNVNPAAVEEYQEVSERWDFLTAQYEDLCAAKNQLEDVIGDINSNMAKRFRIAFDQINQFFSTTYVRLFGGGTARLELQDSSDLLGSGIEIIVQPPGKKLQNLFLLSGGERSLTVIALLFALLSYQPAPFCILDEIDAALDEANVDRFATFLADYALKTQFIVITHRKGTMEAADVLHGVTMEESGISRLLSVKLAEQE
ncbi:MAG: chromosome segregation protein SMC [Acidaminococcaceae bacterium]